MVSLIDTNIIIRFLVADNEEQFKIAKDIFFEIEKSQKMVIILDVVFMEAFFVLTKLYQLPKSEVLNDLKSILALDGVVNSDKVILNEVFNLIENKNIDFVDALLCAKNKLQGFEKISFDKDLKKC
ncbi:PIN domain-containing protein [Aliarcobacter cryaerophilus]|uniref:PIN domain-containing protein n=1 Tax=Aliarcobacter cryaerophilus TaxID=28198 RepID=UPI0013DE6D8E|nr:PIN domain-containing protein [Aliarcobacter cryaerophilus]